MEPIAELPPETVIGGKYRIERLLGRGGMGAVYLAENVDIGRKVALKLLRPELANDPESLARFKQEARAAAAIGHPGIVDVLDFGSSEAGSYIVMERLEGETLRERLQRVGRMSPTEAVELVTTILDTLAVAHAKGVVHRDLKPDNIFLVESPAKAVKILDFGVSKFRTGPQDLALTRTGAVMGTPRYMSPEQARGSREVGPPTDLYSAGAILYEALSGQPPFPGESYNEVLANVLTEPVRPLDSIAREVSPTLAAAVERLLAKPVSQRPLDAHAAAEALRAALSSGPPAVPGTGPRSAPLQPPIDPLGVTTPSAKSLQVEPQPGHAPAAFPAPPPVALLHPRREVRLRRRGRWLISAATLVLVWKCNHPGWNPLGNQGRAGEWLHDDDEDSRPALEALTVELRPDGGSPSVGVNLPPRHSGAPGFHVEVTGASQAVPAGRPVGEQPPRERAHR